MNDPNDMRLILGSEMRDPSKRLCSDPQCQVLDDYDTLKVTREALQRNVLRNHLRKHAVMSAKAVVDVGDKVRNMDMPNTAPDADEKIKDMAWMNLTPFAGHVGGGKNATESDGTIIKGLRQFPFGGFVGFQPKNLTGATINLEEAKDNYKDRKKIGRALKDADNYGVRRSDILSPRGGEKRGYLINEEAKRANDHKIKLLAQKHDHDDAMDQQARVDRMLKMMRHPLILESNYPEYESEEAAMADFGPGGQYNFAGQAGVDPDLLKRGMLPKRYWWQ